MSVDACRKYLTEAGFVDDEVEQIINDLPTAESLNDFVKEISSKSEVNQKLAISREISKRRSQQSLAALREGIENSDNPFKVLWNFLVG